MLTSAGGGRYRFFAVLVLAIAAICSANFLFDFNLFGSFDKYVMIASLMVLLVVFYIGLGGKARLSERGTGGASNPDGEANAIDPARPLVRVAAPVVFIAMLIPALIWVFRGMPGGWIGIIQTEVVVAAALLIFWLRFGRGPR